MHKVQHFKSNFLRDDQMEEVVNIEYSQAQFMRDSNGNLTLESNMLLANLLPTKLSHGPEIPLPTTIVDPQVNINLPTLHYRPNVVRNVALLRIDLNLIRLQS